MSETTNEARATNMLHGVCSWKSSFSWYDARREIATALNEKDEESARLTRRAEEAERERETVRTRVAAALLCDDDGVDYPWDFLIQRIYAYRDIVSRSEATEAESRQWQESCGRNFVRAQNADDRAEKAERERDRLREALKFYADREHLMQGFDDFDTVSGESDGIECSDDGQMTVENGGTARFALAPEDSDG